jgi:hypothetical protein
MAANTLFSGPYAYFADNRLTTDTPGVPLVGWKLYVYVAGSVTPEPVYHDSSLSTAWTQPIVGDASGISTDPIYVSPTPALKILVTDADDVDLPGFPIDNWSPSAVAT